jgi:hypothetical protein
MDIAKRVFCPERRGFHPLEAQTVGSLTERLHEFLSCARFAGLALSRVKSYVGHFDRMQPVETGSTRPTGSLAPSKNTRDPAAFEGLS